MKSAITKSSHASSGFTLIELMVTIVVLAIIVSIAAPNISTQLANQRVKSTTSVLMSVLREARAESSIRRIPIKISYNNGSQSKNTIDIKVPYSGLTAQLYLDRPKDWTSLFFKSAVAMGSRPEDNSGNNNSGNNNSGNNNSGNNNSGGSSTGSGSTDGGSTDGGSTDGGSTDGGSTDGGSTGGGSTDGGSTDGGSTGGGSTGGGSTDGGSTDGGSTDGGSTDGGSTDGGSTDGGSTDGGSTDGGSTDGGSTDGGSTGGGGTGGGGTGGNQNVTFVSIETYTYSANSIIKSNPKEVTFEPQKRVDAAIVYTICDKNASATPRQITVSKLGNISSKAGGTCS